ncbi:MAG: CAP domain-containing protein [Minicystis sp.]
MAFRRLFALALTVSAAACVGACNLVTGIGDLQTEGAGGKGGAGTSSSGAGDTGGASSTSSGPSTSSGSMSSSTSASSSSGGATCSPPCGAHQYCETATHTCVCSPGYVSQGGTCTPAAPGDPTTHTQQDVCDHWSQGHMLTTNTPLTASGAECDAGMLTQAAINDTLVRLNMFRWMAGLGPTSADPALNAEAQKCANLEAWWPWTGGSPHQPPSTSKCYTPEGGATAGKSNIAWGSGNPAQAIDQFMQDSGNETTLGHRRWILNPPLDPVGIGYWQTGGKYGNAECLEVFGASGTGPSPAWVSMPTPGFVPITVASWTWSFHGSVGGIPSAQISMLRVDDNTPLDVTVLTLQQGYGQNAISWTPKGWMAEAGKTYRVTVSGLTGGDVTYDVKPVNCN